MARAPDNASSSHTRWHTIRRWSVAGAAVAALGLALVFVHEISWRARLEAPRPTLILFDRHGTSLTQIGNAAHATAANAPYLDYGYWPLERLPDRVVRATLALEDRRFWSHPGVDLIAVVRALWHNLHGGRRSGASTIAMQVARMQQPARRTLWSKAVEAGTAVALTWRYGRTALLALVS
jgi:penicillin-binding protein 1C